MMVTPFKTLVSPASTSYSITPKANNTGRYRETMSATPTPMPIHEVADADEEWPDEGDWGVGATLEWQAGEGSIISGTDDDASSVAREDAGLQSDEDEDDDDNWGQDAVMTWDEHAEVDAGLKSAESGSDVDESEPEPKEENEDELIARGMPTYRDWTVKKLQLLCDKYGYRTINKHDALVGVAIQCWRAINPPPAPVSRLSMRSSPGSSTTSISSADVPLATFAAGRKRKPDETNRVKQIGKGKQTAAATPSQASQQVIAPELNDRFFRMIRDDRALWTRILRYEPIAFDELVSKAIATGIDAKGWRPKLKRFLDLQGVTFFTEDPTGQRRRH